MGDTLQSLVGTNAANLSAGVVLKLKEEWSRELQAWRKRDLSSPEYVYCWADGIYFTIRLDSDDRQCILVLIGATKDGRKELLAVQDGYRESEQSCSPSTTSPSSTGNTCARRTRSSRPSPPSAYALAARRAPTAARPAWRWSSSSSTTPNGTGAS